jgi:transcriptional regulator GlxA family with amidase domain
MPRSAPPLPGRERIHVSLIALPDVTISSLTGLYDVFKAFEILGTIDDAIPRVSPFLAEIVSPDSEFTVTSSGLPIRTERLIGEVRQTNVIIVPSILVENADWKCGRYTDLVAWLKWHHARGAMLCSACSGVLLLAETGLLDGLDATMHWAYAQTFQRNFPNVRLRLEEVLIATGVRQEIVMSGASASWHDLVLYLIARQAGPAAAQAISRFMLLQWHRDGQAPYVPFAPPTDHGDKIVCQLQDWLHGNYSVARPVEELVRRSGLPERTVKRRFTHATGMSPIQYVQHLRVEEAKRRLERTSTPIDEISYEVGYEDAASFRRLFRRITRVTPGDYRRKFRLPAFASIRVHKQGPIRV